MADERQVYRTGAPTRFVLGLLLLAATLWLVLVYRGGPNMRPEDHWLFTGAVCIALLPAGVHLLLSAWVSTVILGGERLCVRDWAFARRCIPLEHIRGLKWSYRYGPRIFNKFDQGFASLEIEVVGETGRARTRTSPATGARSPAR